MTRHLLLDRLAARLANRASANDRGPLLVAVDGVDGVGKTTFADELAAAVEAVGAGTFRASVDGFHHPRRVRHRRGRHSPEGFYLDSYDLPALRRRLLDPLRPGGDRRVVRAVYDVVREQPVALPVQLVDERAVVLVDGIFLHRPELADRWDLSIFLAAPFAVTVARCAARDGTDPDPAAHANRRYVGGQRRYLAACEPQRHATIVVDHTDLASPRIVVDRLAGR
jgi:uridine kinase